MQRLLIGLGVVVVVVAAAWVAFTWNKGGGRYSGPITTIAPPLKNPMGDPPDRHEPGQEHYSQGRYPEAITLWTAAAASGDVVAAHRLGVEYMDGKPEVVARDYAKALKYHLQAAAGGDALSMFDVGSIYEYGYGVARDIAQAATWYGYSANYGLAQGQHNYATMLEVGEGIARDEVEAYKFFILAGRGGFTGVPYNNRSLRIDQNAPLPTQLLEQRLSPQQQADGRARANSFKRMVGPLKVG